jgi:hypothetical protein
LWLIADPVGCFVGFDVGQRNAQPITNAQRGQAALADHSPD